jgi:ABC-type sugar transport system substrate-binding protein
MSEIPRGDPPSLANVRKTVYHHYIRVDNPSSLIFLSGQLSRDSEGKLVGAGDMAEQTNQVDNFIAQKVDVLIVNLVQSSSAATITEKADAAGIPVVYINRQPSDEDMAASKNICYVGADARQSGTYQGEIVANLPTKGDINGEELNVFGAKWYALSAAGTKVASNSAAMSGNGDGYGNGY